MKGITLLLQLWDWSLLISDLESSLVSLKEIAHALDVFRVQFTFLILLNVHMEHHTSLHTVCTYVHVMTGICIRNVLGGSTHCVWFAQSNGSRG